MYPNNPNASWPDELNRPAYPPPGPAYPPPGPGFAPPPGPGYGPPPARRGGGKGLLITMLVLVAVCCLGVPGAATGYHFMLEDGPYRSVPAVCGIFQSELGQQATGGLSGARTDTWTEGCRWVKDGVFSFDVDVDILRRRKFDDSITRAENWTAAMLENLRDYDPGRTVQADEMTWGIGDEAYLAVSSRETSQGKQQYIMLTLLARVGNVVIRVQQAAFAPRERTPTYQEMKDALGKFREPAKTLFDDIKEDLR